MQIYRGISPAGSSRTIYLAELLCWAQGIYYLVTGVWPLVSIRTFQMITGPKTDHLPTEREADHWLVMTAGVLITAIAVSLLFAAWRRAVPLEIAVLAVGAGIGLTAIDTIYVFRGVIAPVYLVDAAVEVPLIVLWLIAALRGASVQCPNGGQQSVPS